MTGHKSYSIVWAMRLWNEDPRWAGIAWMADRSPSPLDSHRNLPKGCHCWTSRPDYGWMYHQQESTADGLAHKTEQATWELFQGRCNRGARRDETWCGYVPRSVAEVVVLRQDIVLV